MILAIQILVILAMEGSSHNKITDIGLRQNPPPSWAAQAPQAHGGPPAQATQAQQVPPLTLHLQGHAPPPPMPMALGVPPANKPPMPTAFGVPPAKPPPAANAPPAKPPPATVPQVVLDYKPPPACLLQPPFNKLRCLQRLHRPFHSRRPLQRYIS